jgi:hypothetical protein
LGSVKRPYLDDRAFIVLTETKFSSNCHHRADRRVEGGYHVVN